MRLTVGDTLALLSLDEEQGTFRGALTTGVAGAALAELSLRGRVDLADGLVRVIDNEATGEPTLDAVLGLMHGIEPFRSATNWIQLLAATGLRQRTLEGLVDRGILERCERARFGRLGAPRYRGLAAPLRAVLVAQLRNAVLIGQAVSARDACLVALVDAIGILEQFFPAAGRARARQRADVLLAGDQAGRAVVRANALPALSDAPSSLSLAAKRAQPRVGIL